MRREIIDLVFLFKIIHGLVDIPGGFLSWKNTGRCLRNSDDMTLMVPFARTDVFKFSYFVRVTRLWNLFLILYVLFSICHLLRGIFLCIIINFFLLLLILRFSF